jgi:subtilase family serine protease
MQFVKETVNILEEEMYQEKAASYPLGRLDRMGAAGMSLVVWTLALCPVLPATAASGQFIAHNTPGYVATAKNLGTADPSQVVDVSLWLNPHNRSQMDTLARNLYDPKSPSYRHWLSRSQIAARFAPTAEEANTVKEFFASHNLKVVTVGGNNFFVRARGTVGDVEAAFHVQLNNYQVQDKIIRANASDPFVEGLAGPLVRAVSGLDSGEYEHPVMARPANLPSGTKNLARTAAVGSVDSSFYSADCFDGTVTRKFSTNSDGELPIGTYKGNHLNLQSLTGAGCGYTPAPIQAAYHLNKLYAEGYNGAGQTIAIIDWCGSSTVQSDANVFSKKFGLPLLSSANFHVIYTPTPSQCISEDQVEINLDVEWAHSIAPGASIDLVVPPTAYLQDVDQAEFYAVNYGLANSISGSYGSVESLTPSSDLDNENLISEIAAVSGISTNFSSGDGGDYTADGIPAAVNAPADSPWATAVGGVTLALNSDNSIAWQSGWGNNETVLAQLGEVYDPPFALSLGFVGGSGGGPSNCVVHDSSGNCLSGFPKPAFQKGLPGKFRQVPDIAWLADPFTGAVIAISVPGQDPEVVWQVWGGTSLACPMFSALWAIANQEAGAPLGQAAQYIYSLPAGAVTDIVPVTTNSNVTATLRDSGGTTNYSATQVLSGIPPTLTSKFVSAMWDYPSLGNTELVISFGTDCTAQADVNPGTTCNSSAALRTKPGWDNVTGVGTPNGRAFADSFKPVAAPVK